MQEETTLTMVKEEYKGAGAGQAKPGRQAANKSPPFAISYLILFVGFFWGYSLSQI
jgi:hypothetical protein